jgi:hypothetical protein
MLCPCKVFIMRFFKRSKSRVGTCLNIRLPMEKRKRSKVHLYDLLHVIMQFLDKYKLSHKRH